MRKGPVRWSVASGRGVGWRTPLPETGQSGVTVHGGRVFVTSMKPLAHSQAKREGSDIVGHCLDARDGKMLWSVELAGSEPAPYAYGFSDCSSPTPVTDGKNVWFMNSGGKIVCCDVQTGKVLWERVWKPTTGRPFNKQFEPILYKNVLFNVEPRPEGDPKREADPWNWLVALEASTGKVLWTSEDALTHYNTPTIGRLRGETGILLGRGGHHDVPEKPIGASWIRLKDGKRVWRTELPGKALYTMAQTETLAFWLDEDHGTHSVLDKLTGKVLAVYNLASSADVRTWDGGKYIFEPNVDLGARKIRVFPAWFSNIVAGDWHWFLCFSQTGNEYGVGPCGPLHSVGRIHVHSGKCEYLELPTAPGGVYNTIVKASTINSRGIDAASEDRSKRDGWFWNFDAPPVCLGNRIYWTLMNGVTYVLDSTAKILDERALLSVNDLGAPGDSWCLSAPGFDGKHLYYRTMRELIRIG